MLLKATYLSKNDFRTNCGKWMDDVRGGSTWVAEKPIPVDKKHGGKGGGFRTCEREGNNRLLKLG